MEEESGSGERERERQRERGKEKGEDIIHKLLPSLLLALYVSGSSKNPNINGITHHVSIKVGVANTNWVIYVLVSYVPAHS